MHIAKCFYWVLLLFCWPISGRADEATRPNIVFIMADDLGYGDLGCYGQKLMRTPNIDRLAAEGMRFTQAYSGGSVCVPARAVLMTGLHNGHAPARDNVPHYHTYLQQSDVTVAKLLKQAGYRTGGVGKWSLGDAGTVGRATNQGFDHWFGYLNQDHAHYYYAEYLDDNEQRLELPGNQKTRTHYSHDLLTERALRFINEAKEDKRPFFLYAAFTIPHISAAREDEHVLTVPTTEPYANENWDDRAKKYATMIDMLDRTVGKIVNLVDASGIKNNTLIIFTSDNGGHAGVPDQFHTSGPLRGYKRDLTEGGIRVPFIARWPGSIPGNQTSGDVIAFQDILPSCAELAQVAAPASIDGISIIPILKGGRFAQPRPPLYWEYGHCRQRFDQAVRWENWKGIRLGRGNAIQLYDLATDVGERTDVAARHPDIVRKIAQIMRSASTPSEKYPIGQIYQGKPTWKPDF